MDKQDYIDKAETIRTDPSNYEPLDKDITPKVEAKVRRAFKQTVVSYLPEGLVEEPVMV